MRRTQTKTKKPRKTRLCAKENTKCKECFKKKMEKVLHEAKETCDVSSNRPCRAAAIAKALNISSKKCVKQ